MSAADRPTPYDTAPDAAIAAVSLYEGPVLVDLDETLYFRNSTEDFIDCARPSLLAVILLRALEITKPWRWTGGEATRDVWRVRCIGLFFPWTAGRWRRRLAELASRFANRRLITALEARRSPAIIVTAGFRPIVTPLVAALGLPGARIIAARSDAFADRLAGKFRLAVDALGEDTVRRSLVVTDSTEDLPLLGACAQPLRIVWPDARYRRAFSGVYRPGQYLSEVKRPGQHYARRGILQEDFALWLVSSVAAARVPALHAFGLLLLLVSFWAIYERGYVDNDLVADRFEADPQLSPAFRDSPVATPPTAPWIWALVFAVPAVYLLRWPSVPAPLDFAKWLAVLLATHLWFRAYNRIDKATRTWMYLGLQFARTTAFAVLVPVSVIGTAALGAHVLARWVPYYTYRYVSKEWRNAFIMLARLEFFVVLALLLAIAVGWSALTNWTALALLGWNAFKARDELSAALDSATRLDRSAR